MTKERLEEIKTRFNAMKELESFKKLAPTDLFFDDLNWLLQQAERVEELKNRCTEIAAESTVREEKLLKENQRLEKRVEELGKEIEGRKKFELGTASNLKILRIQNQFYRQALEFYADESNYEFETIVSDCDIDIESKILNDGGEKARQGLKGESQ